MPDPASPPLEKFLLGLHARSAVAALIRAALLTSLAVAGCGAPTPDSSAPGNSGAGGAGSASVSVGGDSAGQHASGAGAPSHGGTASSAGGAAGTGDAAGSAGGLGNSGGVAGNVAGSSGASSGGGSLGADAVAMPTFNPTAGPFYGATPVTISSSTPGASIHYTTDGSTPTETHGTLYTGPVTMQSAVNTDMTASFATNASGVTMLKAVASKNGVPTSPVFTGNYIIVDPLRYAKSTSLISGLAHIAYNVSSPNWARVLSLWTDYLGFAAVTSTSSSALIKINDQQYIELYQRALTAPQFQLANWGFYVSDAEALRQQLAKAGLKVPASCTVNALGNLSFITMDPDGHADEWVQYLPNSVTSKSLGQYMPGTQLFGYLEDYGDAAVNVSAADAYYSKCGLAGTGTKVYLPNNNCYLEMLIPNPVNQEQVGRHEKAQLVNFRGQDLLATLDILKARNPAIPQTRSTEGGSNFPMHNCGDVYNADLSRIRMIDINY